MDLIVPGFVVVRAAWRMAALLLLAAGTAGAATNRNLVVNGSFDNANSPLYGWKYKYDLEGESWYFKNHEHVSVVPKEGGRKNVLALWGNYEILQVPGQGTKVDSDPIPVKPGGKYRLTVSARSTGPDCRILVEGYKWRPGIKPHENPQLHELRRCYRSREVFFGGSKGGTSGGATPNWERQSTVFPKSEAKGESKGKAEPKDDTSALDSVQFMVVHIVAIKGNEGNLYVDDVVLERME